MIWLFDQLILDLFGNDLNQRQRRLFRIMTILLNMIARMFENRNRPIRFHAPLANNVEVELYAQIMQEVVENNIVHRNEAILNLRFMWHNAEIVKRIVN